MRTVSSRTPDDCACPLVIAERVGAPIVPLRIALAKIEHVEVWTPEAQFPQVVADELVWHPAGAPEPLTLPLARLFRPL